MPERFFTRDAAACQHINNAVNRMVWMNVRMSNYRVRTCSDVQRRICAGKPPFSRRFQTDAGGTVWRFQAVCCQIAAATPKNDNWLGKKILLIKHFKTVGVTTWKYDSGRDFVLACFGF